MATVPQPVLAGIPHGILVPVERHYQIALLGLVASGYLALATGGLLDLPTVALTGLALVVRALMIPGLIRWNPPKGFEAKAGLCYLVFYPVDWYFLSSDAVTATVHLLLFLGALRLFAAKTPRDFRFVQTLALLQMLAATLTASVYFLVFLAFFLIFGIATLAGAEILRYSTGTVPVVRGQLGSLGSKLAGLTAFIACAVVMIAAGLFFLLPRSAHAAFQHLAAFRSQLPGLSNVVSLGAIGEIQQSDSPLVHVRMTSQFRPTNLKWRGLVLSQFDGHQWTGSPGLPAIPVERGFAKLVDRAPRAPWFQYEVRMKELDSDVLFFAGRPQMAGVAVNEIYGSPSTGYRLANRPPGGFSYTGYSVLEEPGANAPAVSDIERGVYLRLPTTDPRLTELATRWTAGAPDKAAEARAIEDHLRRDFSYTLELPTRKSADPLAYFLFERRKGHCEYFASSMAVLLRLRGIPSRVATGFQSGVMNPVNGWLILRASDAHSWVEAWVDGRGWVTYDPTPSSAAAVAANRNAWMQQARFYLDALDVFWSEWVVGYDFERQLRLAADMHDASRTANGNWLDRLASAATWLNTEFPKMVKRGWPWSFAAVAATAIIIFATGWLWTLISGRGRLIRLRSGGGQRSDATLLYQRMLKALRRRGIDKESSTTADEFALALSGSSEARLVKSITQAYNRLRFGGESDAAGRLYELVVQLEKLP